MKEDVPVPLRADVQERARGRCEYCGLHEDDSWEPHQPDHIIARKHRGATVAENLARTCPACNSRKGPNLTGIDPKTEKVTRLFNPRRHLWSRHFRWHGAVLLGRTAVRRTTVEVPAINDAARLALRQELMDQGLF